LFSLVDGAKQIQAKNYNIQVDVKTDDEFGQLAYAFNDMVFDIRNYTENLEQLVHERTVELERASSEISLLNEKLQEENLRLGAELNVARRLQLMMLPHQDELAAISDLDIAGYMDPADEIGGDYYDVLADHGQIKIGIGDVTGHGLESGVVMLMTQMAVHTLLTSGETDPVRFLDVLNRTLYHNIQRMGTDKNLTLALLDYANGQIRLSGQHEEMIVVRQNGEIQRVDTVDLGFPIGLDDDIADFISHRIVSLATGDGVVLYTDGITEAENAAGEQYGLERLCDVVRQHWAQSADAIKEAAILDVRRHIDGHVVYDDITLVVVKQQ
jgi:sigma-B regulation protein RsbU (phosphoserine phosphatase)